MYQLKIKIPSGTRFENYKTYEEAIEKLREQVRTENDVTCDLYLNGIVISHARVYLPEE